ncbi:COG1361 S-layer family protein [Halomicrobium salinisoli]|uniref:COG1361 S-layer family protein n=1 Tax=Halomicrobium salinisoli TaxID=2878391 RepID=UPI001CF09B45|nr:CARDB domain-containing protein [Halomicrobium salinisoli]
MRGRTLLVVALVGALLVPTTALAAVVGSPDIDAQFSDSTVSPGQETTLEATLVNSGTLESAGSGQGASALNERVQTARGLTVALNNRSAPIDVLTGRQAVGSLGTAEPRSVPFRVSVPEDAEPGTYDVAVNLDYEYTDYISEGDGTQQETDADETVTLSVTVERTPQLTVRNVDSNVRVGGTGTVELTVENTGDRAASDATLTLASPSQDVAFGQSASAERYVESLEPGETRELTYRVTAASTADSEPYAFTLSGEHERSNGQTENISPVSVGIQPRAEQQFTVVETDSDVAVGDRGTYNLTLRNDGPATANDATVRLTSQNADVTLGEAESGSRYVGEWATGETRTVSFDLTAAENAQRQEYALSAAVDYEDDAGNAGSVEGISVGVRPAPEQSFAVRNVSSTLSVGDDGRLTGELVNTGDQPVDDVVLQWSGEQQNVNPTETEYAVGSLDAGEAAEFDFGVEISEGAEAGPRQFSLTAEYDDADGDQRSSDSLNLRREVAPDTDEFDVAIQSADLTPGSSSTIEVRIENADDETLTDISAKMFANDPITTNDDEAFIEELAPGESRNVTFGVSAGQGALAKTYPLSMDFQYQESDGDTVTSDTYNVPVQVQSDDGGSGSSLIAVGIAALVGVLAIGGYLRFR